jgi:hypothetical protein
MTKSPRAVAVAVDPDPSDLARQIRRMGAANDERAAAANAKGPVPVPKKSVVADAARTTRIGVARLAMGVRKLRKLRKPPLDCTP